MNEATVVTTSEPQPPPPLIDELLSQPRHVDNEIGGVILRPIFYGANNQSQDLNQSSHHHHDLLLDYVWRKEGNLSNFNGLRGRLKVIYRPLFIDYVEVHTAYVGKPLLDLKVESQAYMQHYKDPDKGPFKLKGSGMIRDDALQQRYRKKVVESLTDSTAYR
jgi:hypothetical protein